MYKTLWAIEITNTTEYRVGVEPGTFAMPSESLTTTQTARMKSKGVNRVMWYAR